MYLLQNWRGESVVFQGRKIAERKTQGTAHLFTHPTLQSSNRDTTTQKKSKQFHESWHNQNCMTLEAESLEMGMKLNWSCMKYIYSVCFGCKMHQNATSSSVCMLQWTRFYYFRPLEILDRTYIPPNIRVVGLGGGIL